MKYKILESMLLNDIPQRASLIAKESGNDIRPAMMHLIGLGRMGYIASPAKGLYVITQKGKEALGLAATTKECAREILAPSPPEKAFHFYAALDKPLNIYANGLKDFREMVQIVDSSSLEFHLCRGDFEKWVANLGDVELSKKLALLKTSGILGDQLRAKLKEMVENRYVALSNMI